MNTERKDFLSVFRMPPARMNVEEAAWFLGFAPHDIPLLTRAGLLKPLGRPPASGTKFFATVTLQKLRDDPNWLARASDAIVRHWQVKNARQRRNAHSIKPHLQPVPAEQP
jgi:hypothetical protein